MSPSRHIIHSFTM